MRSSNYIDDPTWTDIWDRDAEIAILRNDCELYKAMKDGAAIRIADLEEELARLRAVVDQHRAAWRALRLALRLPEDHADGTDVLAEVQRLWEANRDIV